MSGHESTPLQSPDMKKIDLYDLYNGLFNFDYEHEPDGIDEDVLLSNILDGNIPMDSFTANDFLPKPNFSYRFAERRERGSFGRFDLPTWRPWSFFPAESKGNWKPLSYRRILGMIRRNIGKPKCVVAICPREFKTSNWCATEFEFSPYDDVETILEYLDMDKLAKLKDIGIETHFMHSGNRSLYLFWFFVEWVPMENLRLLHQCAPYLLREGKHDESVFWTNPVRLPGFHYQFRLPTPHTLSRFVDPLTGEENVEKEDVYRYMRAIERGHWELKEVKLLLDEFTIQGHTTPSLYAPPTSVPSRENEAETPIEEKTPLSHGPEINGWRNKKNSHYGPEAYERFLKEGIPRGESNAVLYGAHSELCKFAIWKFGSKERATEEIERVLFLGVDDRTIRQNRLEKLRLAMKQTTFFSARRAVSSKEYRKIAQIASAATDAIVNRRRMSKKTRQRMDAVIRYMLRSCYRYGGEANIGLEEVSKHLKVKSLSVTGELMRMVSTVPGSEPLIPLFDCVRDYSPPFAPLLVEGITDWSDIGREGELVPCRGRVRRFTINETTVQQLYPSP